MTLFTVTISGVVNPIEIYGGTAAAVDYLGSSSSDGAVAWTALAADARSRALVDATRFIDRQSWQGAADGQGGTTLKWPRTGVANADGTAVDSTTVPAALVQAVFELAALIAVDASVQSAVDSGSNISAVGAGTARVSYFRPTSAATGNATVLPTVVNALVGQWLSSAVGRFGGSVSTGTSQGSSCDDNGNPISLFQSPNDHREWPF